jgi:hypothetical protein
MEQNSEETFVDKLDTRLLKMHEKLAKKWQDKTSRDKSDLETGLYSLSTGAFAAYTVLVPSIFAPLLAYFSFRKATNPSVRPHTRYEEKIVGEVTGMNPNVIKSLDLLLYGMGALNIVSGVGSLVGGIVSGDSELYRRASIDSSFGIGVFASVSADYLSRTNPGPPPPKKKKVPLKDRIREALEGLRPVYTRDLY